MAPGVGFAIHLQPGAEESRAQGASAIRADALLGEPLRESGWAVGGMILSPPGSRLKPLLDWGRR